MLPYWILFGIFAAGSLLYKPWDRRGHRATVPLIIAMLLMTLFVGLRYEVGPDWKAYLIIFDFARSMSLSRALSYGDPAYNALNWLVSRSNLDIWAVNLACAAIFAIGLLSFAKRQPNPWLVVAVAIPYLVIVVAMAGTRQATAIGFMLLALSAFAKGSLVRTAIWLMVGSLFHASAILVLGILAASYSRSRVVAVVILAATIAVGYYVLAGSFDAYMDRYTNERLQSQGTVFRIAMNLVPAVLYLLNPAILKPAPHEQGLWRNIAILAILCVPALFFIPSSTALDRLSLYLIPLQMFVLARVPHGYSRERGHYYLLVAAILAYLALTMFVFLNFSVSRQGWIPYQIHPL